MNLDPTVLVSIASLAVGLSLPYISARIKRRENGRINQLALSVRELEAGREMREELRNRVAELEARDHERETRDREREGKLLEMHAALLAIQDDVEDVRAAVAAHIESQRPLEGTLERLIRIEDRIRRGLERAG